MRAHERGLLAAVGNRAAASGGNPMDAGSLMENGTHLMFENQNSTHLLRIYPDGRVDFSGVLMNHRETMVRVLRAPDGVHYRIGSVNYPNRWLQIPPVDRRTLHKTFNPLHVPVKTKLGEISLLLIVA